MKEFSKWFIRVAVYVWIIGAIFGACVVVAQLIAVIFKDYTSITVDLGSLLTFVAAPLTGGIIGYMAKAAFENREKIKQNFKFNDTDKP